ncbi:MAG: DUF1269 domain-containing protein [Anaerolineae bacterium]|nr:DUF1269 domain-containing protein [Anaerolineae bacterium]
MSNVPTELIVAAFQDENGAEAAYKELKQAKKEHLIKIQDAAVIRRDQKNKLHIKDVHDMGGGKGAGIGAVVGGAIGLLAGPVVLVGAAGALIGGLAAKMKDGGFPDSRLKQIGEGLLPGTSAIVAVIEHTWVADLEDALAEAGAQVVTESISADIAAQLAAGKEVAYSAVETDDELDITRTAVGENDAEITEIVLAEGTVMAQSAVVTEDGVAYEGMIATEDGIAYEAAVVTDDAAGYVAAVVTEDGAVVEQITAVAEDEDEEEVVEVDEEVVEVDVEEDSEEEN